jgi:ATP-dependent DNA helicase RecQ
VVFSDASLMEMARYLPRDETSFLQINGVGRHKLERYGAGFLNIITEYCKNRVFIEPSSGNSA